MGSSPSDRRRMAADEKMHALAGAHRWVLRWMLAPADRLPAHSCRTAADGMVAVQSCLRIVCNSRRRAALTFG